MKNKFTQEQISSFIEYFRKETGITVSEKKAKALLNDYSTLIEEVAEEINTVAIKALRRWFKKAGKLRH